MVFNTISYMWMGWDGIGYLPGAVLRAPDGANNNRMYYYLPELVMNGTRRKHASELGPNLSNLNINGLSNIL